MDDPTRASVEFEERAEEVISALADVELQVAPLKLEMDQSRPSSPELNLWGSILDSVSSRRSIPSGNILLLGEPSSGKTTLSNALLQKPATVVHHNDGEWNGKQDFAIGYEWANVKEDEDIVARLSVYSVPSSSPAHLALVPHFLPPKASLPNTLIMIVLDWTKPWSFLEQLQTWMAWVERWVHSDKGRDMQILREEGRDRLQSHLQHYVEPTSAAGLVEPLPSTTSSLGSTLLPLGSGTLTHNSSGVPIIVTCTKADLIDEEEDVGLGMTKGKGGEWEERTDAVMQVLRTICLKYGAALFYTTHQPATLSLLRQYALHFLFTPPPPPPDSAPLKYPFPFPHRANTLDRDRIIVPAGWDSWGKLAILGESFDAARWGEAWEKDLDSETGIVPHGAKDLFRSLVGDDQGAKAPPLPPLVVTDAEQSFLSNHYENLQKDPTRDPRQTFRQPLATDPNAAAYSSAAGVVGPMGSSSLSLPSVERAMMELEGEDVTSRLMRATGGAAGANRRDLRSSSGPGAGAAPPVSIPTTLPGVSGRAPGVGASSTSQFLTPGGPSGSAAGEDGRSQHEVLQSFFSKLLSNRQAAGNSSPAATAPTRPSNGGNGGGGAGAGGAGGNDVPTTIANGSNNGLGNQSPT